MLTFEACMALGLSKILGASSLYQACHSLATGTKEVRATYNDRCE